MGVSESLGRSTGSGGEKQGDLGPADTRQLTPAPLLGPCPAPHLEPSTLTQPRFSLVWERLQNPIHLFWGHFSLGSHTSESLAQRHASLRVEFQDSDGKAVLRMVGLSSRWAGGQEEPGHNCLWSVRDSGSGL